VSIGDIMVVHLGNKNNGDRRVEMGGRIEWGREEWDVGTIG
jgi:hypothetical protein